VVGSELRDSRELTKLALLLLDAGGAEGPARLLARVPESLRNSIALVLLGGTRGGSPSSDSKIWPSWATQVEGVNTSGGRGAQQALAFKRAVEHGCDFVVVMRADGSEPPEALPQLLAPLLAGEADAVFGAEIARTEKKISAIAQRTLARFENALLGTSLHAFNPRYRAFACSALARVPFEKNDPGPLFDTQIIIQLRGAGLRIVEVTLPALSSDFEPERVYPPPTVLGGLKYSATVMKAVADYELHEFGLSHHPEYVIPPVWGMKRSALSSHAQLIELVGATPKSVLDVGCGTGELGHVLRKRGHYVVGVDFAEPPFALDSFVQADLFRGLPSSIADLFDVVLLADVLEHMPDPLALLLEAKRRLKPRGALLVSLPNVVHWSMRAQLLVGRFDYTNKGLLDRGHLRFFTEKSALRLFEDAGLRVISQRTTPVPWERVLPRVLGKAVRENAERTDYLLTRLRPNLFAYQHLFELAQCN